MPSAADLIAAYPRCHCNRIVYARGLCKAHYEYARSHGELPDAPKLKPGRKRGRMRPVPTMENISVRLTSHTIKALQQHGGSAKLRELAEKWEKTL